MAGPSPIQKTLLVANCRYLYSAPQGRRRLRSEAPPPRAKLCIIQAARSAEAKSVISPF